MISHAQVIVARVPRWILAVGDQGLVAILNLLLSIVVTQVAGVAALGLFAIINTTILLALGVARLFVADPWLASRNAPRAAEGRLRLLMLVCAFGNALVVAFVVSIAGGGQVFWYISCLVAFVLVIQDFGRYTAFKAERPLLAVFSDLLVLVVAVLVFTVFAIAGHGDLTVVLVAWAAGVSAGALLGVLWSGFALVVDGAWRYWLAYCRPLATKLGLDTFAYLAAVNGSLYLLAYLGTQQDVGTVRIVQTVFSPATLVVTGLTMWLVPVLANRGSEAAARVRRRMTWWLSLGSVPAVLIAILLGPWLIALVFGISDPPSYLALGLAGVATIGMAVSAPWVASARVTGHYLPIAWTRGLSAVVTIVGMVTVAAMHDERLPGPFGSPECDDRDHVHCDWCQNAPR